MNTKNNQKKVSVIIPCFNQGGFVEDAVLSAVNQTYKNIEIICINDASTDNSSSVLKKLADTYRNIVFFDEKENRGVIYARNLGISAATGDYILPLDADNKIERTFIEKTVEVLEKNPDIGVVCSKVKIFGEENKNWNLSEPELKNILYSNNVDNCALFRKSDFLAIGGYKEYMQDGYEDWDLWLSFLEKGLRIHRIDEYLFNYRKHKEESRTKSIDNKKMNNIYRQIITSHLSLFLKEESFTEKIFKSSLNRILKYKKLNILFLSAAILELIIIGLLIFSIVA